MASREPSAMATRRAMFMPHSFSDVIFTLTGILPPSGGQSKLSGDPRMGVNRELTLLHLM
jgi:hypothetical protein